MKLRLIFSVLSFFLITNVCLASGVPLEINICEKITISDSIALSDSIPGDSIVLVTGQKKRSEAIICWVLGGIVGLHRIYLGTSPVIPVFYALTIGGGIIVFVTDLVAMIVVKDINQYADKDQIIMWIDENSKKQP